MIIFNKNDHTWMRIFEIWYDKLMDTGMKTSPKKIIKVIRDHFSSRLEIAGVYLFGSVLGKAFTRDSDIDIGVLYRRDLDPTWEETNQDRLALSDLLKIEGDLVILNHASPILCYQVLKLGQCILNHDPHAVNQFFVRTINDYFDLKETRRPIERQLHNVRIL
jgi:predicted nucleotidyltransferase